MVIEGKGHALRLSTLYMGNVIFIYNIVGRYYGISHNTPIMLYINCNVSYKLITVNIFKLSLNSLLQILVLSTGPGGTWIYLHCHLRYEKKKCKPCCWKTTHHNLTYWFPTRLPTDIAVMKLRQIYAMNFGDIIITFVKTAYSLSLTDQIAHKRTHLPELVSGLLATSNATNTMYG